MQVGNEAGRGRRQRRWRQGSRGPRDALDDGRGVGEAQAGDQKEGATRQAGDADSGRGDKAGRRPKVGGDGIGRGPKGLGKTTERRGRRGRQATNLTLT